MKIKRIFLGALIGLSFCSLVSCKKDKEPDKPIEDDPKPVEPDKKPDVPAELRYVFATTTAVKTQYFINDEFTSEGLMINGNFSDGSIKELDLSKCTIDHSKFNSKKKGKYPIDITYKDGQMIKTTSYTVEVSTILDNVEHLVGITCEGAKSTFNVNEDFSTDGLVVTATYYNPSTKANRTEDISSTVQIDSSKYNKKSVGTYEIILSYEKEYQDQGKTQSVEAKTFYNVTVASTLLSIMALPNNYSYDAYTIGDNGTFDSPNTKDWVLRANYEGMTKPVILDRDEYTYTIDGNYTSDPTSPNYKSRYTVTFTYTYGGKTATATAGLINKVYKNPVAVLDPRIATLNENYSESAAIDEIFGLKAQVGGTIVVDEDSSINYPSDSAIQFTFGKRIKLQGNGSRDARSISMNLKAGQKVTAYVMSDSSSEAALAGFYDAEGKKLVETEVDGINIYKIEMTAENDGVYYLWGEGSLNVYYVAITA